MTATGAEAKIRNAWMAGSISAVVTLVASLLPLFGISLAGFNLWNLTDFLLIAGLAFGISRRSRVCALLMLAYFVISKVMLIVRTGNVASLVVGALFAYFYFEGVRGTFAWHRLANAETPQPPELAP
jgi:uncharacterized membrane protein YjgN (DUF898 family)